MTDSDDTDNQARAVESLQNNLQRAEPTILVSYGLIGAILFLGGAGYLADRWLGTSPWLLLSGLVVSLVAGLYRLGRIALRG